MPSTTTTISSQLHDTQDQSDTVDFYSEIQEHRRQLELKEAEHRKWDMETRQSDAFASYSAHTLRDAKTTTHADAKKTQSITDTAKRESSDLSEAYKSFSMYTLRNPKDIFPSKPKKDIENFDFHKNPKKSEPKKDIVSPDFQNNSKRYAP